MTSHEKELKNLIAELKAANQTIDLLHEELRRYQETLADAIAVPIKFIEKLLYFFNKIG